ncbi:MAG: hypothetical protein AAGA48_39760 [Myxococcota bacterium]
MRYGLMEYCYEHPGLDAVEQHGIHLPCGTSLVAARVDSHFRLNTQMSVLYTSLPSCAFDELSETVLAEGLRQTPRLQRKGLIGILRDWQWLRLTAYPSAETDHAPIHELVARPCARGRCTAFARALLAAPKPPEVDGQ